MRLAIVTEGFAPYIGGVETRYTELACRLAQEHEVSVFTIMKNYVGDGLSGRENVDGVMVYRVRQRGDYFTLDGTRSARGLIGFLVRLLSEMRDRDFDAVICSEWPLAHVPPIAAFRSSLCVVDWHEVWGRYYLSFGVKGFLGYLLERFIAKTPGLSHVAVSNFTKDRLVTLLGVPPSRVVVIPSGVDIRSFGGVDVKREFGRLIYFGRFMPHKHIEWLVEAFEHLIDCGFDLSLRIVGDGPMRETLKERIRGLEDVELLGPLPREALIREIKAAWTAVIPSVREGQGISYLEAMAAGTPVVAVDSPLSAVRELIENGRNGLLAEPSPSGLVQCITSLLKDEGLWMRIGEEGRRSALRYSWDECASKFCELLEDGMSGKS